MVCSFDYLKLYATFNESLFFEHIYRQKITFNLDGYRGLEVAPLAMTRAVWVRTQKLPLIFIILNNLT